MKKNRIFRSAVLAALLVFSLGLAGCSDDGDTGPQGPGGIQGPEGPQGPAGSNVIDASTASDSTLEGIDVESEITGVTINSAPVVNFTVKSANGVPITGIGSLWEDSHRFVRFTVTKLVPGTGANPDTWVAYTRKEGAPNYDTGSSLVDHGDGTYTFTLNTDVTAVEGVTFEPGLTHRVAGQIGGGSALEAQNLVYDFVPNGGTMINQKNVATMESCNECHDNLVFHGRRFEVEYCVQCHNPDLAEGEGDMAYMTHKIHAGGTFDVLDDGIDYSEVGYPQDLMNCSKCHTAEDEATPQGDNWKTVLTGSNCFDSCHSVPTDIAGVSAHTADATNCASCHESGVNVAAIHTTPNSTANNPQLLPGQYNIQYEVDEASVNDSNQLVIKFRILADDQVLELNNLPTDLTGSPSFRLAYALPQGDIANPGDFNNLGESAGQPISLDFSDTTLACTDAGCTATVANPFPDGAKLRTVALQGYFRQTDVAALHTQSVVVTVTGDTPRRSIVSSAKCAACHEMFEGHGGNRNFTANGGVEVCTVCHVPNLTSSGRAINPADAADRDGDSQTSDPSAATEDLDTNDTSIWPEDTNNFKDMIHGIHASAFRTTDYEFVRGRNDGIYYNWHHVTFPAEVNNCQLCHIDGAFELPIPEEALPTTVRTTGVADGIDVGDGDPLLEGPDTAHEAVAAARDSVPNATDWVSSPTASACYYCHDSSVAIIHMEQNGGVISVADPVADHFTQRQNYDAAESCIVCHGDGKTADVKTVHGLK